MIDIIRYRLINRPRIHSHTIQPRVYISAHHRTIQTIFIHNLFAVKQGIAYTYCVIRQYLPKHCYRCCIFVSGRISAGKGSCGRNQATTQAIASNTTNSQGSLFIASVTDSGFYRLPDNSHAPRRNYSHQLTGRKEGSCGYVRTVAYSVACLRYQCPPPARSCAGWLSHRQLPYSMPGNGNRYSQR